MLIVVIFANNRFFRILSRLGYARYANSERYYASGSNGILAYVMLIIVAVGLIIAIIQKDLLDEEYYYYLAMSIIGVGFSLISKQAEILGRAGTYYSIFSPIAFPMIIEKLFDNGKGNKLIYNGIIIVALTVALYFTTRNYQYSLYG